jgi:hypothetical protein
MDREKKAMTVKKRKGMSKTPKKPRPKPKALPVLPSGGPPRAKRTDAAGCVPPPGMALVPAAGAKGTLLVSDGFNWVGLAYPENPDGQRLTAGVDGPFWANP